MIKFALGFGGGLAFSLVALRRLVTDYEIFPRQIKTVTERPYTVHVYCDPDGLLSGDIQAGDIELEVKKAVAYFNKPRKKAPTIETTRRGW